MKKLQDAVADLQERVNKPHTPVQQEQIRNVKKRMTIFTQNTQRKLEVANAQLKAELAQAKAELDNFTQYMKTQMLAYQKEIIRLKKALARYKAEAGEKA